MIDTEQTIAIQAPIGSVWDFARDIARWAELMPGLQDCEVRDADTSRWVLKVGVGALVRTVKVLVHVSRWDGPGRVDFSYSLEGDPVKGGGFYTARSLGPNATEITLNITVEGMGPMAPMWEAMGKPLLPKLAQGFAEQFKAEIEQIAPPARVSILARVWRWLVRMFRPESATRDTSEGAGSMSEQNKAVALKFIEAFSDGDAETARTCLAPGATTIAKGFGKLSGPRPYEIIVATTAAFKDIIPTGLRPAFKTVTAEADRVAVEFEGNATLANGESYCNEYCMVFTFSDGLIEHVNEYYCTILADEKILPLLGNVEEQRKSISDEAGIG